MTINTTIVAAVIASFIEAPSLTMIGNGTPQEVVAVEASLMEAPPLSMIGMLKEDTTAVVSSPTVAPIGLQFITEEMMAKAIVPSATRQNHFGGPVVVTPYSTPSGVGEGVTLALGAGVALAGVAAVASAGSLLAPALAVGSILAFAVAFAAEEVGM